MRTRSGRCWSRARWARWFGRCSTTSRTRRRTTVPARTPEEICRLFQQSMAEGDIEALLDLYDPEAVFLNQAAEFKKGREGLRQVLAPLAAARPDFRYTIRQVIQAGDTALMHTEWDGPAPMPSPQYAI